MPSELAQSERDTNGIDFRWTPLGMKAATAACLDYSVFVPEKFPFNEGGGVLPAVVGGAPPPAKLGATPIAFRRGWSGRRTARACSPSRTAGLDFRAVNLTGFPLEPGRWMRVQQEVVLNTPGAADGIVRLWADGDLMAEDTAVELRKNKDDGIIGVLADIGYVRQPPAAPGSLQLLPLRDLLALAPPRSPPPALTMASPYQADADSAGAPDWEKGDIRCATSWVSWEKALPEQARAAARRHQLGTGAMPTRFCSIPIRAPSSTPSMRWRPPSCTSRLRACATAARRPAPARASSSRPTR